LTLLFLCGGAALFAQQTETIETLSFSLDAVWLFLGAILVFIMQAGFALVETGFTRARNASTITMKNVMDFCFSAVVYWAVGWGFMYGESAGGFIGTSQFFHSPMTVDAESGGFYSLWFFQVVFAATAATIVSGAMAERTRFKSYLIYTCFISAFIYPVSGHWVWGDGWLKKIGFHDFAGSTVVHSVGGWAALIGAAALGPRPGKYGKGEDGRVRVNAFPGRNIPLAALGTLLLFFGWFGFNGASTGIATVGGGGIWSGLNIARICVVTTLSAAAGAIAALVTSWIRFKKPHYFMALNGLLAGLVGITASCAVVSPGASIVIGFIAGILVVFSIEFIDKTLKVDDPVGASSVHLVCGIWGTLAVGIWGNAGDDGALGLLHGGGFTQLGIQALGVLAVGAWAAAASLIMFLTIKAVIGLRVGAQEAGNSTIG
jgi:Amt family ammonium transporter